MQPLSKNKLKIIQSLKDKKHRDQSGLFVAEGKKIIDDLLQTCACEWLISDEQTLNEWTVSANTTCLVASADELKKASLLKTPSQVIAVFRKPEIDIKEVNFSDKLSLVLDGIQDPGNLGTIIRIADWFGIDQIICSEDTADCFNPKTVQATMGALGRVTLHYTNLVDFLKAQPKLPIYGTFLEGKNIYTESLSPTGFIVMGNEGQGIRPETAQLISHKLLIPNYPTNRATSESLNVATATAIVCSEFRRKM